MFYPFNGGVTNPKGLSAPRLRESVKRKSVKSCCILPRVAVTECQRRYELLICGETNVIMKRKISDFTDGPYFSYLMNVLEPAQRSFKT